MNDYEVTKYTEQRHRSHTSRDVEEFVEEKFNSQSDLLFGIFVDERHIGNIKLGPINFIHKSAEISYFIGEKELWGKGYATKAIKLIIKIAKRKNLLLSEATLFNYHRVFDKIIQYLFGNFYFAKIGFL